MQDDIDRAWRDVTGRLDNPGRTAFLASYVTGFLMGAENYLGAALVMALVEKVYGAEEAEHVKAKCGLSRRPL